MSRTDHKTKIRASAVFLIVFLLCSGCLKTPEVNDHTTKKDTLVWGILAHETINPLEITNDNYWSIIPNIYDGLVEFDVNFRIIPALALSWNNPDNLTWRFNLRQGVTFHNGDSFTAADVKYTIENMTTRYNTTIEEINILDNYTIEFKTYKPTPSLLSNFAHNCIIYSKTLPRTKDSSEQAPIVWPTISLIITPDSNALRSTGGRNQKSKP
jgi:peptide/nickel transport system substrate-binding protein